MLAFFGGGLDLRHAPPRAYTPSLTHELTHLPHEFTHLQVLDKTEDAAQRNLEGLQDELRKTEEQLKRSWSNSLTSCVMIALMLAVFVGTFLFMRLFPKRRWLLW